jgi:hypothetical protein
MREIPPYPRALLFAKLPERLNDEQRRIKYDEPLAAALRESGIDVFIRGFSQPGENGEIEWVGLEVDLCRMIIVGPVLDCLLQLGAPPETVIEIEDEKATAEFTLAEMTGR